MTFYQFIAFCKIVTRPYGSVLGPLARRASTVGVGLNFLPGVETGALAANVKECRERRRNLVNQSPAASPRFSTTLSPVSDPLISVRGLTKIYGQADTERAVTALDNVDVDFPRAQFTAIMGPSGSGKSSLLHILAGLDSFQSGTVTVAGRDLSQLNAAELTRFRRDTIGFIFQAFNLVPTLTVAENIELSAMVRRQSPDRRRLKALVKELDLESRLDAFPSELSGGQQQKVACARALLPAPEVVFADEPTGNLDSASSAQVLSFLRAAARDWKQSVIMVTHEPDAAKYADRVLFLFDGQIVAQLTNPTREAILEAEQNLGDVRQARKRAGQLGAPAALRDVHSPASENDLTAVMSLPKIEAETESEQVELPAEEPAVLPKSAPDTEQSSPFSPYLQSAFPVAEAPTTRPASVPAPPPPTRRRRNAAPTFANLGIAEANPEPNELADSLARGDFKWPSMSVAQPASPDDTNDLLGQPLSAVPANTPQDWDNTTDSSGFAAGGRDDFDSVISGSAELAATRSDSSGSFDTPAPDSGDTGFNPFDFTDQPAPTVDSGEDLAASAPPRRPLLDKLAAAPPTPTVPPAFPADSAESISPPVAPPAANAWASNPPTLVPSSTSSRILSEAFIPESPEASPTEPAPAHPDFPESPAARDDTRSPSGLWPAAQPEPQPAPPAAPEPTPEPLPETRRTYEPETPLMAPDTFARQPEPQPSPAAEPAPKPTPRPKPETSHTYDGPRRSRRPAIDPHLAEAEGKNELLAMIEQAEKLLAASGAAINDATETLQETAAPRGSRTSESTLSPRTRRDATPTPYGGNPSLPSRGKTPDQELLIARADAMLAQAGARSATLQDELRNLGRTPGPSTSSASSAATAAPAPDARYAPSTPDASATTAPGSPTPTSPTTPTTPGSPAPETPNWRTQSLRYPPKGR